MNRRMISHRTLVMSVGSGTASRYTSARMSVSFAASWARSLSRMKVPFAEREPCAAL
jgi:hypothetical protein